jgi:hypothetical protein
VHELDAAFAMIWLLVLRIFGRTVIRLRTV